MKNQTDSLARARQMKARCDDPRCHCYDDPDSDGLVTGGQGREPRRMSQEAMVLWWCAAAAFCLIVWAAVISILT